MAGGAPNTSGGAGGTGGTYNPCPPVGDPCKILPFGDSITDGYTVPGGYRQAYNAAIPAIVKARADAGQHILMVDMYSVIASDSNFKTTLLNADGLHPTTAGYALLGQTWYTAVSAFFH